MSKSAKKFPVSIRLRDLNRFDPCFGGLEHAKEVLGAEPELNSTVAKTAAENNIQLPWIGKALSAGSNYRIAIKLARTAVQNLIGLTDRKVHQTALGHATKLLNKVNIAVTDVMNLRLSLHVAFNSTTTTDITRTGYQALLAALGYLEAAERRDDTMVKYAIECVDKLAQVEAFMMAQKVKAPMFNLFVEALADEKRERILRTSPTKRSAKKKAVKKTPAKKTTAKRK